MADLRDSIVIGIEHRSIWARIPGGIVGRACGGQRAAVVPASVQPQFGHSSRAASSECGGRPALCREKEVRLLQRPELDVPMLGGADRPQSGKPRLDVPRASCLPRRQETLSVMQLRSFRSWIPTAWRRLVLGSPAFLLELQSSAMVSPSLHEAPSGARHFVPVPHSHAIPRPLRATGCCGCVVSKTFVQHFVLSMAPGFKLMGNRTKSKFENDRLVWRLPAKHMPRQHLFAPTLDNDGLSSEKPHPARDPEVPTPCEQGRPAPCWQPCAWRCRHRLRP